jgi:acetyl-CoA acetyltransferase
MTAASSPSVAIVGVGMTKFSRASGCSDQRLAAEAITAACLDAGITPRQLDCVIPHHVAPPPPEDIAGMFGLQDLRFSLVTRLGGASAVGSLEAAGMALRGGLATYVVAYVARNGSTEIRANERTGNMPGMQFRTGLERPHGMSTAAQWYSTIARRHMHEFGTTREQLGSVATTMRRHAQLNPHAQMYGRELTMEAYLNARMIADPYLLFDCCLETDGAAAVVFTTEDRAADGPHPIVTIAAAATGRASSPDDLFSREDYFDCGLTRAAPRAFHLAGLTPEEVDVAFIYDCFTFELIHQLEEGGFCARGEGGPFVEDGGIGLGGRLPVNPHGGLLSEGHTAGMNHVVEAVSQLRGECGDRQVPNARIAAVTGWGDLGDGGMALLRGV